MRNYNVGDNNKNIDVVMIATDGTVKTAILYNAVTAKWWKEGTSGTNTCTMVTASEGSYTDSGWIERTGGAGTNQFGIPNNALSAGGVINFLFTVSGCFPRKVSINVQNQVAADTSGRVKLQPAGLDDIDITLPQGRPTTFPKMVIWLCKRFLNKVTMVANLLTVFDDDNTTVLTTQSLSDDTTTQTQGKV